MKPQSQTFSLQGPATLCVCLLIAMLLSLLWGQGTTWDARNYHLYNAWALLNGHYLTDLAPAGRESYFNPLADVPYYLLSTGPLNNWPRVMAALQGLWYGLFVYVLIGIVSRFATLRGRVFGAADWFAVLIGATSTMAIWVVGETSNDLPVTILVLLGLYLLLPLYAEPRVFRPRRRALFAGLCCGIAVGLKPTMVVYPPAMALALWITLRPRMQGWTLAWCYGLGALLGFALSYGWWGWHLYVLYGNPVFPMFNQVFKSPLMAPIDYTDVWFRPRNLTQWLFYPFYWLRPTVGMVFEAKFADWRFAAAMLAVLALTITRVTLRRPSRDQWHPVIGMLLIFAGGAYILWLVLYSNLRYAIPLGALTGLLVMLALQTLVRIWRKNSEPIRGVSFFMGALFACFVVSGLVYTQIPSGTRVQFHDHIYDVKPIEVEPGSTVIFVGQPNAYLALFFTHPETIHFMGMTLLNLDSQGHGMETLARQRLLANKDSLYAIRRDYSQAEVQLLFRLLPGYAFSACHPLYSNLEWDMHGDNLLEDLSMCRVTPTATTATVASIGKVGMPP